MGTSGSNLDWRYSADFVATSLVVVSSDSESIGQKLVQAVAIPRRDFENPFVPDDAKRFASAVEENATTVAPAEVLLDFRAKRGIDIFVDIVGQFFQYLGACHHGFLPFKKGSRSVQRFPKRGASCSRICKRALW